jgi:DNA-directed RNA polymerase specialized sigma24 family protein
VKAFRHLSRFRAGEPFGPWLLRIVTNETKNLTCSRRRRGALALRLSITESGGTAADGPADEVLAAERRAPAGGGSQRGMSAHARHGRSVPKVPILPSRSLSPAGTRVRA